MNKGPTEREKFSDVFFEARYQIARARFDQAKTSTADQARRLASAKRAITMTSQLYPDLGGEKWRRKFDRLMKQTQAKLGEEPTGLGPAKAATGGN